MTRVNDFAAMIPGTDAVVTLPLPPVREEPGPASSIDSAASARRRSSAVSSSYSACISFSSSTTPRPPVRYRASSITDAAATATCRSFSSSSPSVSRFGSRNCALAPSGEAANGINRRGAGEEEEEEERGDEEESGLPVPGDKPDEDPGRAEEAEAEREGVVVRNVDEEAEEASLELMDWIGCSFFLVFLPVPGGVIPGTEVERFRCGDGRTAPPPPPRGGNECDEVGREENKERLVDEPEEVAELAIDRCER